VGGDNERVQHHNSWIFDEREAGLFPFHDHPTGKKKLMPQLIGGSKVRLKRNADSLACSLYKPSKDDCRERTGRSGKKWPHAETEIREGWSTGGYAWLGFLGMGDDESAVM